MDNRPIGVFDSGLGGLTAVQALRELLPDENIIYFGDTARMPYGTKTVKQLRQMALQDMELLAERGVKAIIAACGTVSSTAADVLSSFHLPVFNVVDASVRAMAEIEGSGPLGVIATRASIESGVFKRRITQLAPEKKVIAVACQSFVELIESGHSDADDPQVQKCVAESLQPLREQNISALLLGCTHFGYLSEAISGYLGDDVKLVSASYCAAKSMSSYLKARAMTGGTGRVQYCTSGDVRDFSQNASRLMGRNIAPLVSAVTPMEVDKL